MYFCLSVNGFNKCVMEVKYILITVFLFFLLVYIIYVQLISKG